MNEADQLFFNQIVEAAVWDEELQQVPEGQPNIANCVVMPIVSDMKKSMDDNGPRQAMLGPTSADVTGKDFTDAKGRHWKVVGKVVPRKVDIREAEKERRNAADYPPTWARSSDLIKRRLSGEVAPKATRWRLRVSARATGLRNR